MPKILTLNKISPIGLSKFAADKYEVGSDFSDPEAIILRSSSMHDYVFGEKLLAVARAGAGVNNIPIDRCSERGIVVFNTPGANANAVAELVLLGLLCSSRPIISAYLWCQSLIGKGAEIPALIEKGKAQFVGPELRGKTLAIIGMGAIGALVANKALALGMRVIGYDPYLSVAAAHRIDERVEFIENIEEVYALSDYISLHMPQSPETKGFVSSELIEKLNNGVRIMNFARGELVDTNAIIAGLDSGKIASYVTDFGNEALIKHPKAICLPHLAASTPEAEENCAQMAVEQSRDYLEYGNIVNSVNFPRCVLPIGRGVERLTLIARNSPQFAAELTATIPNITSMAVQTLGAISYAIVEVSVKIEASSIIGISGLISMRSL